jgi:hypothetical protein
MGAEAIPYSFMTTNLENLQGAWMESYRPGWSESSARLRSLFTVGGRALVQNSIFSAFSEAPAS